MNELDKIRERRSRNTSTTAYNYLSYQNDRILSKKEIHNKITVLEAEMLYIEGYIDLEEMNRRIVKENTLIEYASSCPHCGNKTDYVIWCDVVVYDDIFKVIRVPLPWGNVTGNFIRQRFGAVADGEKPYKSYVLKEVQGKKSIIDIITSGYCISGSDFVMGILCPNCGKQINKIPIKT